MPRPTFSLKLMLASVPAFAAPLAVLTPEPTFWSALGMMFLATVYPPVLWIGSQCGSRYFRSFCLGAFTPAAVVVVFLAFSLITVSGPETITFDACMAIVAKLAEFYRFLLAFFWLSMPLVGLLCVASCWACDRGDAA